MNDTLNKATLYIDLTCAIVSAFLNARVEKAVQPS